MIPTQRGFLPPWHNFAKEGEDYRADHIGYPGAIEFVEILTLQQRGAKRLPEGWKCALPTEAQWEYACRAGGEKLKYSFGDDESLLSDYAWWGAGSAKSGIYYVHRVGQKKANAWGFHDLHGNVHEWCSNWYERKLPGGTDPVGPSSGGLKVFRGGNCASTASGCQTTYRDAKTPVYAYGGVGFRLAVVPVRH